MFLLVYFFKNSQKLLFYKYIKYKWKILEESIEKQKSWLKVFYKRFGERISQIER